MFTPFGAVHPHGQVVRIGEQHLRAFRAGNVKGFRSAGRGHGLHGGLFADGGEGDVRVAVEYEWRMDLIGEDARIVCGGKVGDSLFLVKRKHLADRVVRVA